MKVLILSTNGDKSTNNVIDWLKHYEADVIRINDTDDLSLEFVIYNPIIKTWDFSIVCNNKEIIRYSEIDSYWYRRGELKFKELIHQSIFKEVLKQEISDVTNFIHLLLNQKRHINSYFDNFINKNVVLYFAEKIGLLIPPSLITTQRDEVVNFQKVHNNLITKHIKNASYHLLGGKTYVGTSTVQVDSIILSKSAPQFGPSLFQKNIEKEFEIRSFYLEGTFYSMAIFSQQDQQTQTDFRNYNYDKPNRNVPFLLPKSIENKLLLLFQQLGMNCGSVDLIYSKSKEYYFLEINPIGQFDPLVINCNYKLEQIIAKYLINYGN